MDWLFSNIAATVFDHIFYFSWGPAMTDGTIHSFIFLAEQHFFTCTYQRLLDKMVLFMLFIGLLAIVKADYTPEALADQVKDLPGTENLDISFNHFSGYLSIPGLSGSLTKHMHYWLVESSNDPSSDPLAFWTNGGPVHTYTPQHVSCRDNHVIFLPLLLFSPQGCSGLIGMLTEQGPFRPNADMTISLNKYAWNTVSNMVFIESPAGHGHESISPLPQP